MSIRYKLGFAFAAVLLLAGGLALYGMQTISRTGDAVIRLYDEPLVAVNRARAADANFDKARVTMGRAMAFLDRVPEDELHRLDALVRDVLEDLKIVRDRVNDQRVVDALDTAQFLIRDWHETGLKILRPAPGGLTEVPLVVVAGANASEPSRQGRSRAFGLAGQGSRPYGTGDEDGRRATAHQNLSRYRGREHPGHAVREGRARSPVRPAEPGRRGTARRVPRGGHR